MNRQEHVALMKRIEELERRIAAIENRPKPGPKPKQSEQPNGNE